MSISTKKFSLLVWGNCSCYNAGNVDVIVYLYLLPISIYSVYFAVGQGPVVTSSWQGCDERVRVFVCLACLSARIFKKPHAQTS